MNCLRFTIKDMLKWMTFIAFAFVWADIWVYFPFKFSRNEVPDLFFIQFCFGLIISRSTFNLYIQDRNFRRKYGKQLFKKEK